MGKLKQMYNKKVLLTCVLIGLLCVIIFAVYRYNNQHEEGGLCNNRCCFYKGDVYYTLGQYVVKSKKEIKEMDYLPEDPGDYEIIIDAADYLEKLDRQVMSETIVITQIRIIDDMLYCNVVRRLSEYPENANHRDGTVNLVVTNPDYSSVMAFDLNENKLINKLTYDSAYYNYVDISVVDDRLCIRYGDEMNSYNKDLSESDPIGEDIDFSGTDGAIYDGWCYTINTSKYASIDRVNLTTGEKETFEFPGINGDEQFYEITHYEDGYWEYEDILVISDFIVYKDYLYCDVVNPTVEWGFGDGEGIYRCNLKTKKSEYMFDLGLSEEERDAAASVEQRGYMNIENICSDKMYVTVDDNVKHKTEDGVEKICSLAFEIDLKSLNSKRLGYYDIDKVNILNGKIIFKSSDNDYSEFVNEDIYQILLEAGDNYDLLFSRGKSISEQIEKGGVSLEKEHYEYLDRVMPSYQELIHNYTNAYKEGRYSDKDDEDSAYHCGWELYSLYEDNDHLTPDYLLYLIVFPKLSEEFQLSYMYTTVDRMTYHSGEEKKTLHLIGYQDALFKSERTVREVMEYYRELPILFLDNYQVIEDDNPDKTVCHIINVSHTDRLFEVKFKDIKKRAAKTCGTNEKEINIIKDDSQGWIFTNSNGDLLGKLNEEDASVYEAHEIVYDLINKKRGDIDRADKLLDQLEGSEADPIW